MTKLLCVSGIIIEVVEGLFGIKDMVPMNIGLCITNMCVILMEYHFYKIATKRSPWEIVHYHLDPWRKNAGYVAITNWWIRCNNK